MIIFTPVLSSLKWKFFVLFFKVLSPFLCWYFTICRHGQHNSSRSRWWRWWNIGGKQSCSHLKNLVVVQAGVGKSSNLVKLNWWAFNKADLSLTDSVIFSLSLYKQKSARNLHNWFYNCKCSTLLCLDTMHTCTQLHYIVFQESTTNHIFLMQNGKYISDLGHMDVTLGKPHDFCMSWI